MKNAPNFATNKQKQPLKKNNMNTQTNKQTTAKEKMLFALLFVVPVIAAAALEIVTK